MNGLEMRSLSPNKTTVQLLLSKTQGLNLNTAYATRQGQQQMFMSRVTLEQHSTQKQDLMKGKLITEIRLVIDSREPKGSFVLHNYDKNKEEYRDWQLSGGTANILKCQKPGTEGQGGDEENLGRWAWIQI